MNWRRLGKYLLVGLVTIVGGLLAFMWLYRAPARDTTDLKIELTPERVARGRYLAEHVLGCVGCHTRSDYGRFSGPDVGEPGAGGDCFEEAYAPGTSIICVPNITPHPEAGVGAWTDDELLRAVREGVDREGRALYSLMRFYSYRALSDQDAHAVVAWMRSLKPVSTPAPATELSFVARFASAWLAVPLEEPVAHPNPDDPIEWGGYLAQIAGCRDCHTMFGADHKPIAAEAFGGGELFPTPLGPVRAANLTSHPTGSLAPSVASFIARFRAYRGADVALDGPYQTIMPWLEFAEMTDADLTAIHTYLRSQPAFERVVPKYPTPDDPALEGQDPAPSCAAAASRGAAAQPWHQLWAPCRR